MSSFPSGASAATLTVPVASTLAFAASGPGAIDHAGRVPVGQPAASGTAAGNVNFSPARSSFLPGCTSRRAGSPALPAQRDAGFGSGAGGGFGGGGAGVALGAAGAALALGVGGVSPSRRTSENDRDRTTLARHVVF